MAAATKSTMPATKLSSDKEPGFNYNYQQYIAIQSGFTYTPSHCMITWCKQKQLLPQKFNE